MGYIDKAGKEAGNNSDWPQLRQSIAGGETWVGHRASVALNHNRGSFCRLWPPQKSEGLWGSGHCLRPKERPSCLGPRTESTTAGRQESNCLYPPEQGHTGPVWGVARSPPTEVPVTVPVSPSSALPAGSVI